MDENEKASRGVQESRSRGGRAVGGQKGDVGEHDLEKLTIWRKARELAVEVYGEVVPSLPKEELWGLASQLRRASVSVAANIAEGHGRYYFQERIRSCYLARGSLEEVETLLIVAQDLGYLKGQEATVIARVHDLRRMLNSYVRYLKGRAAGRPSARLRKGAGRG